MDCGLLNGVSLTTSSKIGPMEKLQGRSYNAIQCITELYSKLEHVQGYEEAALDHLVAKIVNESQRDGEIVTSSENLHAARYYHYCDDAVVLMMTLMCCCGDAQ